MARNFVNFSTNLEQEQKYFTVKLVTQVTYDSLKTANAPFLHNYETLKKEDKERWR